MSYTSRKVYEFISKQTNPATDGAGDPIVERKTCRISGTQFPIFQSDLAFYKKASPTIAGKIYAIPLPTICPEERERRRLAFRNERKLYKRTCDATNKDVISLYSPANPYTVYDQKYRQSDAWDPLQYGVPYESTVSMQKMFVRLHESFPRISLNTHLNENSEYTNQVRHSKDCYMCFDSGYLEDSLYCSSCFYSSKCLECYMCKQCTDCFQCVQCIDCYASLYSYKCKNCTNALQSSNCENCSHIFQCENLQHQSYCILNKQVTKEEFEIYVAQHMTTLLERPHASIKEHMEQQGCENCTGDLLYQSKNAQLCRNTTGVEDCKYCYALDDKGKRCMDTNNAAECELIYECLSVAGYQNHFSIMTVYGRENLYCFYCRDCTNCFGCMGLRNKQYCVFNNQYTKQEYERLVPKLIKQMEGEGLRGEFFDPSLSPFGYNETLAMDYYPLTKQEALERGYKRSDYEYHLNIPENAPVIKSKGLTDQERLTLRDDDSIINKIILCEVSQKPFRIIKQELEFYRKHDLPLPRKHPELRHQERLAQRPGRTLYLRTCDRCTKEILSVYPTDYKGKVYCEDCYQKTIYS